MELIYTGKTKDVYRLEDGTIELRFKDDVTGVDGVFDPGANTVGLTVDGIGRSGLRVSKFFFEKLKEKNIATHYLGADLEKATMHVKDAEMFGTGLEVICRYKAVGSFYKRFGAYCTLGQDLAQFVEVTLKDDERGDPPISKSALVMLGIIKETEYDEINKLTKEIATLVKNELLAKDLVLYDLKFEFGRDKKTGEIMLIDEISGGNMRVYKAGQYIEPLELEPLLLD